MLVANNERTVFKGQKKLRCGYTTGTCAAAAAKAAAAVFLEGIKKSELSERRKNQLPDGDVETSEMSYCVQVRLPNGECLVLEAMILEKSFKSVRCGVIKDAGDDPDVTDGMMVCASVSAREMDQNARDVSEEDDSTFSDWEKRIRIDGGEGIGRVTKAGLNQPVGAAAINAVPRRMIREAVSDEMKKWDYDGGIDVLITIPEGVERAEKTLNAMLGIEGGLSVLGTSGIVEPMSEQALIDTIGLDIRMHLARHEEILVMVPGNYGEDFLTANYGLGKERLVKISNFVGESIDRAVYEGAKKIVVVGHIGKLIKVAGGIMNTHSHQADARMEILTAYAAVAGAKTAVLQEIMQAVTTDAGLEILKAAGLLDATMKLVTERIQKHLEHRAGKEIKMGVILFSNQYGLLGKTETAEAMLSEVIIAEKNSISGEYKE